MTRPRPAPGTYEPPRFVPPRPEHRPVQRRRAARVLLLDTVGRVLLFEDSDLGLDPVLHWWVTPGGGVDEGESDVQAAVREVHEETGRRLDAHDLIGPFAVRSVVHGYSDKVVHQDEVFFAAHVAPFTVDVSGHTDEEQETVHDIRWWTRAELATTSDDIWPRQLVAILDLLERPEDWAGGPVRLPAGEESAVPA